MNERHLDIVQEVGTRNESFAGQNDLLKKMPENENMAEIKTVEEENDLEAGDYETEKIHDQNVMHQTENEVEFNKENVNHKDVTIEKEQMGAKINEKCNVQAKRHVLPGQPEEGELPSTNLTTPTFTEVPKRSISSQKFPCFIPKSKLMSLKQVIHYSNQNFIL